MKKKKFMTLAAASLMFGSLTLQSCEDSDGDGSIWDDILGNLVTYMFGGNQYSASSADGDHYFGYLALDENNAEIEDDILLSTKLSGDSKLASASLPTKVDLTDYLPPIGDQGQYGTCVGWAVAYNCRTFLNAKQKGLSKSALTKKENQFSPKDLFWSIDNSLKGSGCAGTAFEYAFDVLVSRGCATLATIPYTNMGSCNKAKTGGETEAARYKIKSYREINLDKNTIKQYLANGQLVVFGAELGDEFMLADGSYTLTKQTTYKYTGQHAYHALVCCGYDDSKNAFRIANSWDTSWGDKGYLWVDQDYFISNKFAYGAYVAYLSDETRVDDQTNTIVEEDKSAGTDLLAYNLEDVDFNDPSDPDSNDPTWRTSYYDVYNAGSETVPASSNWGTCLLAYNAYNGNDYEILFLDFYTDLFGKKGEYSGNGVIGDWSASEAKSALGVVSQAYCWSNIDLAPGKSLAEAVYGDAGSEGFSWTYKMPNVTGYYYLVLFADAFGGVSESNEENNYYYVAQANGDPLKYENGVLKTPAAKIFKPLSKKGRTPLQNQESDFQSVVTSSNVNAYSTDEIAAMIRAHKKSGSLSKKATAWVNSENGKASIAKSRQAKK